MSNEQLPELIWTITARADVAEIYAYIAHDSEYYADGMIDKINARANELILQPYSGKKISINTEPATREVYVHPYRIIYAADDAAVYVIRVLHHARLLKL